MKPLNCGTVIVEDMTVVNGSAKIEYNEKSQQINVIPFGYDGHQLEPEPVDPIEPQGIIWDKAWEDVKSGLPTYRTSIVLKIGKVDERTGLLTEVGVTFRLSKAERERLHREITTGACDYFYGDVLHVQGRSEGARIEKAGLPQYFRHLCNKEVLSEELNKAFQEKIDAIDSFFLENVPVSTEPTTVECEVPCHHCRAKFKIRFTLIIELPTTPRELIRAYEAWKHRRDYMKPSEISLES